MTDEAVSGEQVESQPAGKDDPSSGPIIAMVATTSDRLPDPADLLVKIGVVPPVGCLGAIMGKKPELTDDQKFKDGNLIFEVGGAMVAISLMPGPIPWDSLETPCSSAWWWPGATETMRNHTHHFIVAMVNRGEFDAVQASVVTTRIAGRLAERVDAVGVYWGAGGVVQSAEVFCEQAAKARVDDIPTLLWIGLHPAKNEQGQAAAFTTGMESLGFKEIEIPGTPLDAMEMIEFLMGTTGYIIENRLQLEEGETVGRTADEKYTVKYGESMLDRGEVMQLHPPA